MKTKQKNGPSSRAKELTGKLGNKSSRDTYVDAQVKSFLASQIRNLRGEMSQSEFGKLIGKPQSVVSRLEDPNYGKVTLQTLLDIASKLDIALIVRFASYSTYLKITSDTALETLIPSKGSQKDIEALAKLQKR